MRSTESCRSVAAAHSTQRYADQICPSFAQKMFLTTKTFQSESSSPAHCALRRRGPGVATSPAHPRPAPHRLRRAPAPGRASSARAPAPAGRRRVPSAPARGPPRAAAAARPRAAAEAAAAAVTCRTRCGRPGSRAVGKVRRPRVSFGAVTVKTGSLYTAPQYYGLSAPFGERNAWVRLSSSGEDDQQNMQGACQAL